MSNSTEQEIVGVLTERARQRKQSGYSTPRNIVMTDEMMILDSSWNSSPTVLILVFTLSLLNVILVGVTLASSFNIVIRFVSIFLLNFSVFGYWLQQANVWIYKFSKSNRRITIYKIRLLEKLKNRNKASSTYSSQNVIKDFLLDDFQCIQILQDSKNGDSENPTGYKICFLLKNHSEKLLRLELSLSYDLTFKEAQRLTNKIGSFLNIKTGLEPKLLYEWLDEISGTIQ